MWASTDAPALLTPGWPAGYSWNAGVAISGVQPESGLVSGLPSFAACWIAVIGRQVSKLFFAFQTEISASASAMFINASTRALVNSDASLRSARSSATRFQIAAGVSAAQNFAVSV